MAKRPVEPLQSESEWHLDKRIPIALIVAIVVQTFGMGWWASSIATRVASLEKSSASNEALSTRVAGVEGKVDMINTGVQDLKQTLNAITVVQVKPAPVAAPGP